MKQLIHQYEHLAKLSPEHRQEINRLKESFYVEIMIDELVDLIKDIATGSTRIKRIVQDLRNFSRLDEAELKTVDIHESLDTSLNLLGHLYENRITVHKQYGDLPPVECYAGQLNQVFMNLLANAAQAFDQRGNVWITTTIQDASMASSGRIPRIAISIRDDGRGIPEDVLPKVFDPFFTTKDVGEGTGLGLSISYGIIEKHLGEITATSKMGEGTEFTVIIPQKLSAELHRKDKHEERRDEIPPVSPDET
jgi:two-component system NtrC family sensor kinase